MGKTKSKNDRPAPPYLSFKTFQSGLDTILEHGIPDHVDKTLLKNFSGSGQSWILATLKFFDLINDAGTPNSQFKEFSKGSVDDQKKIFQSLIQSKYSEQVKFLPNGTIAQVQEAFDSFNIEASVKRLCVIFFLKASEYSGLEINPRILKGHKERGPKSPKKKKPDEAKKPNTQNQQDDNTPGENQIITVIPVGPGKLWKIISDKEYTTDDIEKFLKVSEIVMKIERSDE